VRGGVANMDAGVQLLCPHRRHHDITVEADWDTADFDFHATRDDKVPLWRFPSLARAH